jgi:hypothetical protein
MRSNLRCIFSTSGSTARFLERNQAPPEMENEFVIDKIIAEKIDENGVKKYLIKWQDYVGVYQS